MSGPASASLAVVGKFKLQHCCDRRSRRFRASEGEGEWLVDGKRSIVKRQSLLHLSVKFEPLGSTNHSTLSVLSRQIGVNYNYTIHAVGFRIIM